MHPGVIAVVVCSTSAYALVIEPLWAFIESFNYKYRGTGVKFLWGTLMLLTWPLGGWLYGVTGAVNKWLRRSTYLVLILSVASLVVLVRKTIPKIEMAVDQMEGELSTVVAKLDKHQISSLAEMDQVNLKVAVQMLQKELKERNFHDPLQPLRAMVLSSTLLDEIKEGRLNFAAYQEWMEKFNVRGEIGLKELVQEIKMSRKGLKDEITAQAWSQIESVSSDQQHQP